MITVTDIVLKNMAKLKFCNWENKIMTKDMIK